MNITIDIDGTRYVISVACAGYVAGPALSHDGEAYVRVLVGAIETAKRLAAQTLIGTHNETWADDEHPSLTPEQFVQKLTLKRIVILDTPNAATLYFDDGDLFGGHWIAVSVQGADPDRASLEG
jgi:hypothetical protein